MSHVTVAQPVWCSFRIWLSITIAWYSCADLFEGEHELQAPSHPEATTFLPDRAKWWWRFTTATCCILSRTADIEMWVQSNAAWVMLYHVCIRYECLSCSATPTATRINVNVCVLCIWCGACVIYSKGSQVVVLKDHGGCGGDESWACVSARVIFHLCFSVVSTGGHWIGSECGN